MVEMVEVATAATVVAIAMSGGSFSVASVAENFEFQVASVFKK
jgi:hypothetical protein